MKDIGFILLLLVYPIAGYVAIQKTRQVFIESQWILRLSAVAFVCSLFFGIGVVGGGGDPGFASPAPLLVAGWYARAEGFTYFVTRILTPFFACWLLYFIVFLILKFTRGKKLSDSKVVASESWDAMVINSIRKHKQFQITSVNEMVQIKTVLFDADVYEQVKNIIQKEEWSQLEDIKQPAPIGLRAFLDVIQFKDQHNNPFVAIVYDSDALEQDPEVMEIFSIRKN